MVDERRKHNRDREEKSVLEIVNLVKGITTILTMKRRNTVKMKKEEKIKEKSKLCRLLDVSVVEGVKSEHKLDFRLNVTGSGRHIYTRRKQENVSEIYFGQ